jgi:mutual gliding-motility protein MglA
LQVPIVLQYNKRDLVESNIPLLPIQELECDLNEGLNVPFFEASAANGNGVYETLREISKRTIRSVIQKVGGQITC